MPGVKVTLRSPALKYELYWRTEAQGTALFSELPAGTYAAEAELEGFLPGKASGIELNAEESRKVELVLAPIVVEW